MTKKNIGDRFGRLIIVGRSNDKKLNNGKKRIVWICQCDCGNIVYTENSNLGRFTNSCGCIKKEMVSSKNYKHGCVNERLYPVWEGMRSRCLNPNSQAYKYYGGRGIEVCEEWNDYLNFRSWAYLNGYDESATKGCCTIDRIDCDKGYEPSNCRWVNMKEQNQNRHQKGYLMNK